MPDLFNFKTAEQFKCFVDEVLALRELIKCPVCLDWTKNPIRINCDHVFCSECIETFVNTFKDQAPTKIPQCPICRKAVNRHRKPVKIYVEAVLNFVDSATTQIQAIFGCDISLLAKLVNIENALKKKNICTERRLSTNSSNILHPTVGENKNIDVFDQLKNIGDLPKSSKKKYTRKSKNSTDESKVIVADKIQNFENVASKENITQWLHDTKNRFERMTQTQDLTTEEESDTQNTFNMDSVSQNHGSRPTEEPKKRPRSLEVTVTTRLVKMKRHSFTVHSEEKKINIEDDSDEKTKEKFCTEKTTAKRKQKNGNNSKNKTGWGRIKKINKTINKRQTKMLPVSLTSTTPREKDLSIVNPIVILNKFQEVECFEKINEGDLRRSIAMNENLEEERKKQANQKENIIEDFECLTTKASQKASKLLSGKIFSDEEDEEAICSAQCLKSQHETCRKAAPSKTPEKNTMNITLVDDAATTLEELKSFLNVSNVEKAISCLSKLKLIVDHLHKTNNRSQNTSINKSKSILSTQTCNFDMKSVCVQTDTPIESGFKISTADAFKTREYFEKEVQTDQFYCPNCKDIKKAIATNKKYEFTQSFDNMDFDTQQLVNNSKTPEKKSQTKRNTQRKQPEKIDAIENNSSQVRSIVETPRSCLEFSLSNRGNVDEMEKLKENVCAALKTYKRIRAPDSDSENESNSKKKKLENKYLADNLSVELLSEDVLDDDEEPLKPTDGSLSLDKCDDVDYDAYLNNILKKYDANIDNGTKAQKQKISTDPKPSTSKKTESQTVMERCEAMIRKAETKKLADSADKNPLKKIQNEIPKNNEKDAEEDEDIPEIVRESPIDVAIEDEFNEPFEELPKSAAFKLSTESFMANMNIDNLPVTNIERSALEISDVEDDPMLVISNADALIEEYSRDFDGTNPEKSSACSSKVTVLQNLVVKPGRKKFAKTNSERSDEMFNSDLEDDIIETTPKKNLVLERRSFSQAKPSSLAKLLLPLPPPGESPDVISSIDPIAFLDQTFAPPTEFQDFGNMEIDQPASDTEDLDVTMVPVQASTPPRKSTQDNDENKETENKNLQNSLTESEMMRFMSDSTANVITSTQRTNTRAIDKIVGISPIRCERKRLNPIEEAQKSRFSPLDVISVKSQTPQKVLTPAQTKQKSILSFMRQESRHNSLDDITDSADFSMPAPSKPCICCTRLNRDQILGITSLTSKKLATYSNSFTGNVTHMVVSVNENNFILDHTVKFLMAVANGKWIVNFEWIRECIRQNRIVSEAPYEVLDVTGLPGPRNSRILRKKRPLLLGYKIHIVPPFSATSKEEVEQLITLMGGELIPEMETIAELSGIRIILTEAKSTQDYFKCERWLETYRVVTVDLEWLSRSIGQYKVLSLRSFVLCTDENIESLGYPAELIEDTQSMSTQNINTAATKY